MMEEDKVYLYPPLGYKWNFDGGIDTNDGEALRDAALNLSDDLEFQAKICNASTGELLDFFKENGFEFRKEG